jgi:hypothetical protein
MATELPTTNGHSAQDGENNFAVKAGLARMLKGGVIMDVVNAEQVCVLGSLSMPLPFLPWVSNNVLASNMLMSDDRPALQKKPAPQPSWLSSACLPTSEPRAA